MPKISIIALLSGFITVGCGGGSPQAEEPAPTPEPVEVIEEEPATAETAESEASPESVSEEAPATETAEEAPEETDEAAAAEAEPQAPPPSDDLQAYVNASTGYTPEYRTVMDNMATFKQCYLDAMRINPDLAGNLTVRFTVEKNGAVKKAKATVNELDDDVSGCVIKALKKIKFPKRGKKRTVEYPFKFIPSPS